MSSAAQIAANRRNARRATGPRSQAGKARAARNALRHGLTARVMEGTPAGARVAELAQAFLDGQPGNNTSQALARAAAEAQYTLELVRLHRLGTIEAAERNPATYTGSPRRGDIRLMCSVITAYDAGKSDLGSPQLEEMLARQRRQPPEDPAERLAEVYGRIASSLTQLDRYQGRALARRRQALDDLANENGPQ